MKTSNGLSPAQWMALAHVARLAERQYARKEPGWWRVSVGDTGSRVATLESLCARGLLNSQWFRSCNLDIGRLASVSVSDAGLEALRAAVSTDEPAPRPARARSASRSIQGGV